MGDFISLISGEKCGLDIFERARELAVKNSGRVLRADEPTDRVESKSFNVDSEEELQAASRECGQLLEQLCKGEKG